MTPPRPVNTNKPSPPQPSRPSNKARPGAAAATEAAAAVAKVAEHTAAAATPASAYTVTVDVSLAASVRSDTQRIDSDRLEALKSQVRSGNYKVDPHALAARIAEEALEPTALE